MKYWLIKSEPSVYSIDDLARDRVTSWEGVRNFQARNFIRDEMSVGDLILFYHSNAAPPCVAGLARVVRAAYPDQAAFDKNSSYYDPRSTPEKPLWFMVDIAFDARFQTIVSLEMIKNDQELSGIMVAGKGVRLSVQPVAEAHFKRICRMGDSSIA